MTLSYAVDFRGFPACPCQATWLPAFEHEAQRRGWLSGREHFYQIIGGLPQSGGTHLEGGADDTSYVNDKLIWLSRQMGADATWHRRYNWDGNGGGPHVHRVLRGCPHNGPARYQVDAVDDDYNGLGHLGHGAPDDGPRPLSGRTWREGIAWAKEQENPNMALLADLDAVRKSHGVSRIKAARVLLRAVLENAGPIRAGRIRTALVALKGIDA